jgi:tetratricopeptide (TPR) repeat protein/predicted Ser/Thr protein kinase
MEEQKPKKKPADDTGFGVRAPSKGDSSSSGSSPALNSNALDNMQTHLDMGATISDANMDAGPSSYRGPGRSLRDVKLQTGDVIGGRYEILMLLGEGGMGSVYKARDREVDRDIALKVIRPDLASNPAILARFKQELLTAHLVTHKNVIRIYDLAESDGLKFITMEFVEGCDLRKFCMDQGKLSTQQVVEIVRQVCLALDAAHSVGVIHRDLKPQNIMRSTQGRILVMDFGLARSMVSDGLTQTGMLLGTMEYMSPEQAMGKQLDQRSDLFALGLIFYEILTGKLPFKADSAMASLLLRNQERAVPASQLDAAIPQALCDIVSKCLERDLPSRYGSAQEILNDLDAWQGNRVTSASGLATAALTSSVYGMTAAPSGAFSGAGSSVAPTSVIAAAPSEKNFPWKWVAVGALAVTVGVGGWAMRGKFGSGKRGTAAGPVAPEVSLAILPFHNSGSDTSADWIGQSLADMLSTDVGQSGSMRTISSDRLHQIMKDMRVTGDADLDSDSLRRIAEVSHADTVVWGQYEKVGGQIRIKAQLEDLKRKRTIPLNADTASESALKKTVDKLAGTIQQNLSLSSAALAEVKSAAFTPSSNSVDALKSFTEGKELAREGNHIEAVKHFEAATKADPNFSLAYSMLGQTYSRLGYQKEAEQNAGKAAELSGNLPAAEKYMIQAANARISNNYPNALAAYNNLTALMPNDVQIQFELGELYEAHGDYDNAHKQYAKALESDPKHIDALRSIGQVEYERGNPQGSLDYLNRALSLAVELNNRQGKAIVLHDLGEAYGLLNRPQDALQNYQQSLEIKQQVGDKLGMAASLDNIAVTYGLLGKSADAEKTFKQELAIRKELGDQAGLGVALLNFGAFLQDNGKYEEALTTTKQALQIEMQMGYEPQQARCLTNIGYIYFQMAKYEDAQTYQQRAVDLLQKLKMPGDLAAALNNVGLTYTKTGQLEKAQTNYLLALEQARNVGDKVQLSATSDSMAELFMLQGRFGAALNAQQDALKYAQQLEQQAGAFMAETQADYATILNKVGRGEEAQKILEESLKVARSTQNDVLTAKVLSFQGESFYYRGDYKAARPLFEQAQQSATKAKDRVQSLTARVNLARVNVKDGRAAATLPGLKSLCPEADTLGVKYLALQCSIGLGDAYLNTKDYSKAESELLTAVRKGEELGMKSVLPETHYLLSQALRKQGNNAEADRHQQMAAQMVEQMRQESKSDGLKARADLKGIAEQSGK